MVSNNGYHIRLLWIYVVLYITALSSIDVHAQGAKYPVNELTTVDEISYAFPNGKSSFATTVLSDVLYYKKQRGRRIRKALSFAPAIDAPEIVYFSPVELIKDTVRLRKFYAQKGFLNPTISYDLRVDTEANEVDIVYVIEEGAPLSLGSFEIVDGEGNPIEKAILDGLRSSWMAEKKQIRSTLDPPIDLVSIRSAELKIREWFQREGYAFVTTKLDTTISASRKAFDARIEVNPGPRGRIGEIRIEGAQSVDNQLIRRQLLFSEGDLYNGALLAKAQDRLLGLELFRLVVVRLPPQPNDSLVSVQVRLIEGKPRRVSVGAGYTTAFGVLNQFKWSHLNLFETGNRLDASILFQTGLLSPRTFPERKYASVLSLRVPLGKISAIATSGLEYKNDLIDESLAHNHSLSVSSLSREADVVSLSLGYNRKKLFSVRRLNASFLELLVSASEGELDTLNAVQRSHIQLSSTLNRTDNLLNPGKGYILKNSVETSGPKGMTDAHYVRINSSLQAFIPIGEGYTLRGRLGLGRLIPHGASVPQSDDEISRVFLGLTDLLFYGGGTNDVRGWAEGLLGPKFTDFEVSSDEIDQDIVGRDTVLTVPESFYAPLGGMSKVFASVELGVPFVFERSQLLVFIDAGRVWTPDERFVPSEPSRSNSAETSSRVFWGTGMGFSVDTLVGKVGFSIGYKLNPSTLDIRDPKEVLNALLAGESAQSVEPRQSMRFNFHFSLGTGI